LAFVLPLSACSAKTHSPLLGGQTTVHDTTPNAFGLPAPGLSRQQELLFFVGNSFFKQNWVTAPSSTAARDGLGPLFNTRSCAGCHFKDGRGRPPEDDGETGTGFLIRLSIPEPGAYGADLPDPVYGGQVQDRAIEGVPAEAAIRIDYTEIPGQFADGTAFSLREPSYEIVDPAYGELDPRAMLSPRVANQMIGLGLLEAVPEQTILALADPADEDRDGISGRPNYVWDTAGGRTALGRFGWKAGQPSLYQQTAGAFLGDIGITTSLFREQDCMPSQTGCMDSLGGGDPEISDDDLAKVVLYASSLAVPAMRGVEDPQVILGEKVFHEAGCDYCHTPRLETGVQTEIPALSNQTIYPYTDLLLHDMGDGLADGRPEFEASGREWRTPPLWGIGLIETVNGHTNLLHDGRARGLAEAILWHGGEAEAARDYFISLPADLREALLTFLEAL
jgi:CxxC motif-containing protein (DUF1111 family)